MWVSQCQAHLIEGQPLNLFCLPQKTKTDSRDVPSCLALSFVKQRQTITFRTRPRKMSSCLSVALLLVVVVVSGRNNPSRKTKRVFDGRTNDNTQRILFNPKKIGSNFRSINTMTLFLIADGEEEKKNSCKRMKRNWKFHCPSCGRENDMIAWIWLQFR